MKRGAVALIVVAAVGTGAAWFVLRHRIPSEHRWILSEGQAVLYEMDVVYEDAASVGEYSRKPFLTGNELPTHFAWRPVAGPRAIDGELLAEFRSALRSFDKESSHNPEYDCAFEPRTCVVFQSEKALLEVFVCVYCRYLMIEDEVGTIVASGFLHGSYKPFVAFVANTLPEDSEVQRIKAELGVR